LSHKFAHVADCHIGAWRDPKLRELNDSAFERTIDLCILNRVDFLIISGDIFDIGIPEMSSVRSAVRKLKELIDANIPVYVVYGSHDYSPTTVSVVEVLTEAGLFSNAGRFEVKEIEAKGNEQVENEKRRLVLQPLTDKKTGVQIAGLPARRGGLEKAYYAQLKENTALAIDPERFSIFVFHASVNELQTLNIPVDQNVSIRDLPLGFSYYAGGHLHKRSIGKIDGSPVVYPGPLFGTSYTDLELTAKGEKRGFAIVEFEGNKTTNMKFIDLPSPRILSKTFKADGKSSTEIDNEINEFISKDTLQVKDSIALLRIRGTLSSGKPSDIDWYGYRTTLLNRGALVASLNRMGLATKESKHLELFGKGTKEEIESKLLSEHISSFKSIQPELAHLSGSSGTVRASRLLDSLKTEKREEETKSSFAKRVTREASQILDFPFDDEQSQQQQEAAKKEKN
jgi:exonuclease SbcD